VLAGLLSGLRDRYPTTRVVVLSGDPAATTRMHGVEAWPRGPRDVWRALRGTRLLISGGGSLVQDVTSARSAVYYAGTMLAASARGVPVAVLGQGVGPLRRRWVRWLAALAFRRAAAVSVRDDASGRLLQDLGVRQPIVRGADLAFLLPVPPEIQGERLLEEAGAAARRPRIGLALRPWPDLVDPASIGRAVREGAGHVVGLVFDRARDAEVTRIAAHAAVGVVVDAATPQDLLAAVGPLDAVVAVRLHALIFAARCGVPALAVAYDPKVRALADEIGCPWVPASASARAIADACAALMAQRAAHRDRLAAALPRLELLAQQSLESVRPWA
jgi:polysaccharide pyruvyl transferase CsaB